MTSDERREQHWDAAYRRVGDAGVSWYQPEPRTTLAVFDELGVGPHMSVLDSGGGASALVDHLLDRAFTDVSVLDVSDHALGLSRDRLGDRASRVHWVAHDVLTWQPARAYDVWHDRAVFHFLTSETDRLRYLEVLASATTLGSHLILATFAADGPESCSGLPVARYSPQELRAAVGAGWAPGLTLREEHRTPGGGVQPFTWAAFTRC